MSEVPLFLMNEVSLFLMSEVPMFLMSEVFLFLRARYPCADDFGAGEAGGEGEGA